MISLLHFSSKTNFTFCWGVHCEQWVYKSWDLFVFNSFSFFRIMLSLKLVQELKKCCCNLCLSLQHGDCVCLFIMLVYIVHLHNLSTQFAAHFHVILLCLCVGKGLFDLGFVLLCLGFRSKAFRVTLLCFVLVCYFHMYCAYCWCSSSLLGLDQ
jgi:hypothetical protein